jgi:hypothetical protein
MRFASMPSHPFSFGDRRGQIDGSRIKSLTDNGAVQPHVTQAFDVLERCDTSAGDDGAAYRPADRFQRAEGWPESNPSSRYL